MKKLAVLVIIGITLSGCGYTSVDNELTGQVKRVMKNTPLICPDYYDADISMGVFRGGIGSASTQDQWLVIPESKVEQLKKASNDGSIVKVAYDVKRTVFCTEDHFLTKVDTEKQK